MDEMQRDFYTKSETDEKLGGMIIERISKADFDQLTEKDLDKIYFVYDDNSTLSIYIGHALLHALKNGVVELNDDYSDTQNLMYYADVPSAISAIANGSANLYALYVETDSTGTSIPEGAFANSTKIGKFKQGSITEIGTGAFANATNLKNVELSNGLLRVGDGAFINTKISNLTVPDTVTSWGKGVIQGTQLTDFTIPRCVTEIESSCFAFCNSLENVTITRNVRTIKSYAFYNTPALTSLEIPANVLTIEARAFDTTLTSITINKPSGSISGAPWGATNAQITWTG